MRRTGAGAMRRWYLDFPFILSVGVCLPVPAAAALYLSPFPPPHQSLRLQSPPTRIDGSPRTGAMSGMWASVAVLLISGGMLAAAGWQVLNLGFVFSSIQHHGRLTGFLPSQAHVYVAVGANGGLFSMPDLKVNWGSVSILSSKLSAATLPINRCEKMRMFYSA
jgi:hypothetical protein